jgi:exopolysaccharide biosynthesis polyprenyl glycosylphosphotransferase
MGSFFNNHSNVDKIAKKTRQILLDIRAPDRLKLVHFADGKWQEIILILVGDLTAWAISWYVARYLNQFYLPLPPQFIWWTWFTIPSVFWLFAVTGLILFAYGGLYNSLKHSQNYLRAGKLISYVYVSFLVIAYLYDPKLDLPRSLFFTTWFLSVSLTIAIRLLLTLILRLGFASRHQTSVFIIAPASRLYRLKKILAQRSVYRIVGASLASTAHTKTTLQTIINSGATEVLAENLPQTKLASNLYWQLRRYGINLRLIPSSLEILHRRGVSEIYAGIPTLRVEIPFLLGWDYRLKRFLDVVGALVGIIILAPVFMTIAIAIKLSSPGSIFFRQERIGLHGKVFHIWKFRTMITNASAMQTDLEAKNQIKDGIMFKIQKDPRIIPIGHFLRRTSLDELPQLFNVLSGQMSLVGPRPLPLRDVERFDSWHHIRHQVLPGITGLWQISGRSDIEEFDDAARLDLYYIDNWSLNLDLDILLETIRVVLFGKGAY